MFSSTSTVVNNPIESPLGQESVEGPMASLFCCHWSTPSKKFSADGIYDIVVD